MKSRFYSFEALEDLGWLDIADEERNSYEARMKELERISLDRYYEHLARLKAKNKKYRKDKP